jgi:hypothetical protein
MTTPTKASTDPSAGWHPARLIPTTGIGGPEEQEQRATSSLLAVMQAVPDFGRALLVHAGAPSGRITTYTEIQLKDAEGNVHIPDGAILVERGKVRWCGLVEVKTGGMQLRVDQVSRYLDMARLNEFDAVITISNDITSSSLFSPITVDIKRLKKVALRHLSWYQVMTEAILQQRHRGISDPDQAWILGELIAYLDNERSGAGGFEDMGDKWVAVRDAARQQVLRASTPGVREVPARWEQFIEYLALGLQQDLGRDVTPIWSKKIEPAARLEQSVRSLVDSGCLAGALKVPDAAAPIDLEVNLRTRQVSTSASMAAPREGRPVTRINWLIRQLKDAPPQLRIEVRFPNARDSTSMLLKDAREAPQKLLLAADPKREPREFKLAWSKEMGSKRGKAAGSFVGETKAQTIAFYRDVVQPLKVWSASAPKLPVPPDVGSPIATAEPPDFTAGTRDAGEGLSPRNA